MALNLALALIELSHGIHDADKDHARESRRHLRSAQRAVDDAAENLRSIQRAIDTALNYDPATGGAA